MDAEALRAELAAHHARFSPVYQDYLSDHGPMAALALTGLGAEPEQTAGWLRRYRERLEPLSSAPVAYRRALAGMQADVARLGSRALLVRELPGLVSGWAKHAYHPLIRAAYGYAFDVPEEVAAGLAYLQWCGPDPQLASVAAQSGRAADATAPFAAMKACATRVGPGRRFDDCLSWVRDQQAFRTAAVRIDQPLAGYSREALAVFDATHDFFALHLVTGAHAYRLLYEFAGPDRDAVFALGLLAGYASTGAPDYRRLPSEAGPHSARALQHGWRDEHRIKLACTAVSQAGFFRDPAYERVAEDYLSRR